LKRLSQPLFWARETKFILFGLGPEQTSLRGVWILAVVFFGSLAIAAILTPCFYWLAEGWDSRTGSELTLWLHDEGIARTFDLVRLVMIALALPLLLRACWSVPPRRLPLNLSALRAWTLTYVIGLGLIAALAVMQLAFAPASPRPDSYSMAKLLQQLTTSSFVGLFEEIIFRGIILSIFYTSTRRPWLALVLTSASFAYAHFKIPTVILMHADQNVNWLTGWAAAYWTLFGITADFDLANFSSLFLLGMVLGALRLRSATLWPAIGLHSGMVMGILVYNDLYLMETKNLGVFWGTTSLVDGWAAATALILTLLCLVLWPRKASP